MASNFNMLRVKQELGENPLAEGPFNINQALLLFSFDIKLLSRVLCRAYGTINNPLFGKVLL